ncbi:MAG: glycosyltransferase [Clostridiales bacterium]|nr:glycosyltransferase [Clostridiales bacterium]
MMVSVIIPVYNVSEYLEQCLNSVIGQSYTDLEIILVDDGSTDDSGEICEKYAKSDERVRVFHKENGGLSSARNCGLKQANGECVVFIDSDDYVDADYVKTLIDCVVKYDADICECEYVKFCEGRVSEPVNHVKKSVTVRDDIKKLLTDSGKGKPLVVVWNKIYKRDLLGSTLFEEGRLHEDEFFTYKTLYGCKRYVRVNKPLYFYRQRSGSIMNGSKSMKSFADMRDAFRSNVDYFTEIGDKRVADYFRCRAALTLSGYAANKDFLPAELRDEVAAEARKYRKEAKMRHCPLKYRAKTAYNLLKYKLKRMKNSDT